MWFQTFKVRLHDATKLMRRATKCRCVNGLICATCDCCMLSQESWNPLRQSHVAISPFTQRDFDARRMVACFCRFVWTRLYATCYRLLENKTEQITTDDELLHLRLFAIPQYGASWIIDLRLTFDTSKPQSHNKSSQILHMSNIRIHELAI